jgi:VanZ family protein
MSSKPGIESHKLSESIVKVITNSEDSSQKKSGKVDTSKTQPKVQPSNNTKSPQSVKNNTAVKNEANLNKNKNASVKAANTVENKAKVVSATKSNSFDLDNFVRKNAHAFEYIVLAILVSSSFFAFNKRGKAYIIYILFICLFYAVTDEFHQSFVPGRTSLASDILIDFSGAIIGTTIFYLLYYKVIKRSGKIKQGY